MYKKVIMTIILMISFFNITYPKNYGIQNAGNYLHPWASEVNPAVIAFQNSQIALGLKAYQVGILQESAFGIKESHVNGSFPFLLPYDIGTGFGIKYFSAGIYSEIVGEVMFSKQIVDYLAIGFKAGLEQLNFTKENFVEVDERDPLLSGNLSKVNLTVGFGLFWNFDEWYLGLGINHINNPNIGFEGNIPLSQEIYGSISKRIGWLIPGLLIEKNDEGFRYGFTTSFSYNNFGNIQFSMQSEMPIKIEAQFSLSGKTKMNYSVELPGEHTRAVSVGNQEVILSYELRKKPDIVKPEIILSTKRMEIREEKIIRSMPSGLSMHDLNGKDEILAEFLTPKTNKNNMVIINSGALNRFENNVIKRHRYQFFGQEIQSLFNDQPDLSLVLRANERSIKDARQLKRYFSKKNIVNPLKINIAKINSVGSGTISGFISGKDVCTKEPLKYSVKKVLIGFLVPGSNREVNNWDLKIINSKGNVLKTFKGKNRLPENVEWNWKNEFDETVSPGKYQCVLNLRAKSGKNITSESPCIEILHFKRTVNLSFKQPGNSD